MDFFLCDLFDVPNIGSIDDFTVLINTETNTLQYESIYKHPRIHFNLMVSKIWTEVYGVPPSKIHTFQIAQAVYDNGGQWTVDNILRYIRENTFMKYVIAPFQQRLDNAKNIATQYRIQLTEEDQQVKTDLYHKLAHTVVPGCALKATETMMTCKSKSMPMPSLYGFYQQLIAKPIHEHVQSTFEAIHRDMLYTRNIYTGTVLDLDREKLEFISSFQTLSILDCLRYVIYQDYYFLRTLISNPCVYVLPDSPLQSLLPIVCQALDKTITDRSLINVFGAPIEHRLDVHIVHMHPHGPKEYVEDPDIFNDTIPSMFSHMVLLSPSQNHTLIYKCIVPSKGCLLYPSTSASNLSHPTNPHFRLIAVCGSLDALLTTFRESRQRYILPYSETQESFAYLLFKSYDLTVYVLQQHFQLYDPDLLNGLRLPQQVIQQSNYLIFLNKLIQFIAKADIQCPNIPAARKTDPNDVQIPKKCVLMFDNRENIMNIISAAVTIHHLDTSQWDFVFVGSEKSCKYVSKMLGNSVKTVIDKERMEQRRFHIEVYNEILKDPKTWKKLIDMGYKHALVIQDDGMLLRKGLKKVVKQWEYAGAPWLPCHENTQLLKIPVISNPHYVGNGGLSYRNIETMHEVCLQYPKDKTMLYNSSLQPLPEDIYFGRCIWKKRGVLPTLEEAKHFAMEQIYEPSALGIHKFWMYQPIALVKDYMDRLLSEA